MAALDDVISVVVTANSAAPTREGFGTPMIVGYHTVGSARSRVYSRPSEMIADGFTTASPHYKAAVVLCSQKNKPKNFKIGKCLGAPAQTSTLTLQTTVAGEVYTVDVTLASGVTTTVTRVSTAVLATDATALAASIQALGTVTSAGVGAVVTTTTTTAGSIVVFSNWSSNLRYANTTVEPGTTIQTDLANIFAEDSDFYGVILTQPSEAIVNSAAVWANSNKKLLVYATADYGCTDAAVTTDVMSDVKSLSYDHVAGIYNGKSSHSYADAAWMGSRFPYVPGKSTWQFKTLVGVPVDTNLTTAQKNALKAKNGSFYITLAGVNVTQGGAKVASGEYIDVIHFLDWLVAEIQFRIYSIFVNSDKIPYTDPGIDAVTSAVLSALQAGVSAGGLAASPAPTVTAPAAADVSSAQKATRDLPGILFTCTLAGAIHTAQVEGTVS